MKIYNNSTFTLLFVIPLFLLIPLLLRYAWQPAQVTHGTGLRNKSKKLPD